MGDRRQGIGANLTASEASVLLPGPICWVLLGLAVPIFSNTGRANPGKHVRISATENHGSPLEVYNIPNVKLPFIIGSKQWEKAVLPLLDDPRWDPINPINQALIRTDMREYLRLLGIALGQSFSKAGYGPYSVE